MNDVLQGYKTAAPDLIARFECISPAQVYGPVIDLLPTDTSRIADIGAGTGRDAAWLAERGHAVLAVEPVDELRRAGMALHTSPKIVWLDDRLPDLMRTTKHGPFDFLLLSAVWQHLNDDERRLAVRRLRRLTAPGGMLIMSLRHGPGAADRPVYGVAPDDTVTAALNEGFTLARRQRTSSVQAGNRAAGVYWTWLAFTLR
jgi:SAM-dependent methyltransferase